MSRYKYKHGSTATVECEVEVDIDEYLEHATTSALIEELSERDYNAPNEDAIDKDALIDMLCNQLSITQSQKLRIAINLVLE